MHGVLTGERSWAEVVRLLQISVRRFHRKLEIDGVPALVHGLWTPDISTA